MLGLRKFFARGDLGIAWPVRADWGWLAGAIFFGGFLGPVLLMYGLATSSAATASLLLNFESVEYLSSAALGKLITLNKRIKEENGELKLCNIIPEIYEVFRITKLNRLFEIFDDMEQALRRFKKRGA